MKSKIDRKIKLLRVITQSEVVPWHLKNFIERSENDYDLFIVGENVSKYKVDYPYVIFIDCVICRKASLYSDFKALIHLIIICIKVRPQIVHSIMPKAGFLTSIAALVTFIPIRIHTFTGQVWSTRIGFSRFFYKLMDRLVLKLTTRCLTDSPSQSLFLARNGFLEKGKPIECLGKGSLSGVDLGRFNVDIVNNSYFLKKELGIAQDDFVYIFLARKTIVKGIKELFESFSKITFLPNIKLLFIGPDESEGYLDELYIKYANICDKIISIDMVNRHEEYLAISDVLCLPSSSEGFGSIVIEAAALGVPTIGFEIVGLVDSIENNSTGILIPFKDVDKFADAMISLYKDRVKLREMKFNSKERAIKYFSAEVLYSLQNQFYKTLLT